MGKRGKGSTEEEGKKAGISAFIFFVNVVDPSRDKRRKAV